MTRTSPTNASERFIENREPAPGSQWVCAEGCYKATRETRRRRYSTAHRGTGRGRKFIRPNRRSIPQEGAST